MFAYITLNSSETKLTDDIFWLLRVKSIRQNLTNESMNRSNCHDVSTDRIQMIGCNSEMRYDLSCLYSLSRVLSWFVTFCTIEIFHDEFVRHISVAYQESLINPRYVVARYAKSLKAFPAFSLLFSSSYLSTAISTVNILGYREYLYQ